MKPCFLWIITHTPMIPVVPVCLYILCSPVIFCSPGRSQNQPIFSVPWVHKTVLLLLSDITWMWALHPTVPSSLELSFAGFLQTPDSRPLSSGMSWSNCGERETVQAATPQFHRWLSWWIRSSWLILDMGKRNVLLAEKGRKGQSPPNFFSFCIHQWSWMQNLQQRL